MVYNSSRIKSEAHFNNMHEKTKPYNYPDTTKKEEVEVMFNNIAPQYDFLNHFLSFGIDNIWRKKAVKKLSNNNINYILDLATGTGDFAIQLTKLKPKKITGIDISEEMLKHAQEKIRNTTIEDTIEFLNGDSENIGYPDKTFDAVTVAFGVRNFENLDKSLQEMNRILKNEGKILILELTKPEKFPVKHLYNCYSTVFLSFFGKLFSKDKSAYTYLPKSISSFQSREKFVQNLIDSGFEKIKIDILSFGIATIFFAQKKSDQNSG